MKQMLVLGLLAMACSLSLAADTSLNGEWLIHRSAAGRESTQTCTFAQEGHELGGTCSSQDGPVELKGTVDGNKVAWTIRTSSEGGPVTIVYEGTVDSESAMSGTVRAVEFGIEGDFKANRSK